MAGAAFDQVASVTRLPDKQITALFAEQLILAAAAFQSVVPRSTEEKVAELVDEGSIGARTVSRFLQAGAALEQGESERAVELYASIAADTEAPQALRDLALIREVSTNFDDREPQDVIGKLEALAVPGNAYFGSAGELVAIAHLEAGNREEAGAVFSAISQDEGMPETLRNRTRQMAGLLGVDAIVDVEELLEQQGAGTQNQAGP